MQQLTPPDRTTAAKAPKLKRAPMYDLPSEFPQEPGLPDVFHDPQPALLSATLKLTNYGAQNRFTGSDLNLYYDKDHRLWHKRPDWFLAVGVPLLYDGTDLRESYVAWDDKETNPSVIVELLSPGTAKQDLGPFFRPEDESDPAVEPTPEIDDYLATNKTSNGEPPKKKVSPPAKWVVYQDILKVPNYIVFDRRSHKLWFFKLVNGKYEQQPLENQNPRLWLDELGIGLGIWEGEYDNITRSWLRWFDESGDWIPTPEEHERRQKLQEKQKKLQERRRADEQQQRADEQQQRADESERRAALLLEKLKQQGIEVDLDEL